MAELQAATDKARAEFDAAYRVQQEAMRALEAATAKLAAAKGAMRAYQASTDHSVDEDAEEEGEG
jgi:hypothetical protein